MKLTGPLHTDSPTTVPDCSLDDMPIPLDQWTKLSPEQLASIVGTQEPGDRLEHALDYTWRFEILNVADLEFANEDGDAPHGGWRAAHERHLRADKDAVRGGSPEYAGRDEWLRDEWCQDSRVYPLFVVKEDGRYRLWDGYRRLAGAFYYGLTQVASLVGTPR